MCILFIYLFIYLLLYTLCIFNLSELHGEVAWFEHVQIFHLSFESCSVVVLATSIQRFFHILETNLAH